MNIIVRAMTRTGIHKKKSSSSRTYIASFASLKSRMETNIQDPEDGQLLQVEVFWRDQQPWLEERGYILRPRYQVDRKASWVRNKRLRYLDCEDVSLWGYEVVHL
jgi:hypothetical protein